MGKKLLVIVDMQNDFITGPLGNEECRAIVPNVVKKVRKTDADVVCTLDTHYVDYLETQEGKKLPIPHCIKGTEGWQMIPELNCSLSFEKSTFGSVELANWIKKCNSYQDEKRYTEIELIGVCTDICVISNAFVIKAANPEVEITVDASCCAGVTPETHKAALETMKMCQINVIGE